MSWKENEITAEHIRRRLTGYAIGAVGFGPHEDLLQDVFVVLAERYGHLTELAELVAVAFEVLRLKARGQGRTKARRDAHHGGRVEDMHLAAPGDPEEHAIGAEVANLVAEAVATLPPPCASLMREHLAGASLRDLIASGSDPAGTVYARAHRSRQAIVDHVREQLGGGG